MTESPRVTIGIPTYNRAITLVRAIESALLQHNDIEVVVTDNASTDETQGICERYAATDRRIRYIRHASNLGAVANFEAALQAARGYYFMWLGDDDWLEPGYVTACTDLLDESPEHYLVSGMAQYFEPGAASPFREDRVMVLEQPDREERVLSYFALVRDNGVFYGVSRRKDLLRVGMFTDFGGDCMQVACFAFLGKVRTLQTVHVNRTFGGSSSPNGLQARYALGGYFARPENHDILLAWRMYLDVTQNAEIFKTLGPLKRQHLGLAVADTLLTSRYRTKTLMVRIKLAPRRRFKALLSRLRRISLMHGAR